MNFEDRVIYKLNKFSEKTDDICEITTRMEEHVNNHLTQPEKNTISNRQKIYFALGLVGSYALGFVMTLTN